MKIFCDLDGVLVHQTGRDGFDQMPWMPDGKELWEYVKQFNPTILSQLSPDIYTRGSAQKRVWVDRELGKGVPLIVVMADTLHTAKWKHSGQRHVLIDDHKEQHRPAWVLWGGVFIHHIDTRTTILKLKDVMQVVVAKNYLDTAEFAS